MKSNINVCPRPFIILLLLSSLMYVWVLKPHNLRKNKENFFIFILFFPPTAGFSPSCVPTGVEAVQHFR